MKPIARSIGIVIDRCVSNEVTVQVAERIDDKLRNQIWIDVRNPIGTQTWMELGIRVHHNMKL